MTGQRRYSRILPRSAIPRRLCTAPTPRYVHSLPSFHPTSYDSYSAGLSACFWIQTHLPSAQNWHALVTYSLPPGGTPSHKRRPLITKDNLRFGVTCRGIQEVHSFHTLLSTLGRLALVIGIHHNTGVPICPCIDPVPKFTNGFLYMFDWIYTTDDDISALVKGMSFCNFIKSCVCLLIFCSFVPHFSLVRSFRPHSRWMSYIANKFLLPLPSSSPFLGPALFFSLPFPLLPSTTRYYHRFSR